MGLVILVVIIILGFLCYDYFEPPVSDTSVPASECINYVLTNSELLRTSLHYQTDSFLSEDEKLMTDGIYPITVYDTYGASDGFLIDFYGDNGCMIINEDLLVSYYRTKGEYEKLDSYSALSFSPYDGIVVTLNGTDLVLDHGAMTRVSDRTKVYEGQSMLGEGGILSPERYLADRYGGDYQLISSNTLPYFTGFDQADLSLYYSNYGTLSEGNCTLTAIFTALSYLKQRNYCPTLPASITTVTVDATLDSFYETYLNDPSYVIETPKTLPLLYTNIRDYAIDKLDYQVGDISPLSIESMCNGILKKYNCDVTAKNHYLWSYGKTAIASIDRGYPVVFNTAASLSYSSHSMVIRGYRSYRREVRAGDLLVYDHLLLLEIADSWEAGVRYFDTNVVSELMTMVTFE